MKNSPRPLLYVIAVFALLFAANNILSGYIVYVINLVGIFIIATVSLNITNGYTGLFSLGHAGFMAIGGYISTILSFPVARKKLLLSDLPPPLIDLEIPFALSLIVGGLFSMLVALVIGLPVLRLRGHYLSVATLGMMVIVTSLSTNLTQFTRGPLGINGIPAYANSYWIYGWAALTIFLTHRLVNSKYGRAMKAIREDEIAAKAMGIDVTRIKVMSFVVGAFFAGVAGGLYAHLITAIVPWTFSFVLTFDIVIMLIVGGMGSISGSILGATMITVLKQALKPIEEATQVYGLVQLLLAMILVVTMLKRPRGILGDRELSIPNLFAPILKR